MAGYNTCSHGHCTDCGYAGFEHHPECDTRTFSTEETGTGCTECVAAPDAE